MSVHAASRIAPRRRTEQAPAAQRRCDATYYQHLHEQSAKYQQGNWLLDQLPVLAAVGGHSIVEVGCGNGLFLARATLHWGDVTGVDWARSPVLQQVLSTHPQVRFLQQDLCSWQPPRQWDLLVSADLLEHLPPSTLAPVIARLGAAAPRGHHKIACYDDGHSHLALLTPEAWLALFQAAAPAAGWRIASRAWRKPPRKKLVVVISNLGAAS